MWRVTALLLALLVAVPAAAGVTNPNISVIGQPFARWTDDAADPSRKRVTFDPGEVELFFDADLNPYARGVFALALGDEGLELEEGYFTLNRGLPVGLALKAGKYRAGFGRLNAAHPHTYPFAERFRVLAAYLPGEESLNEVGLQLSELIGLSGDVAITASIDAYQGDTFRIDREAGGASNDPLAADPANGDQQLSARPAGLGRVSAFLPLGEASALELGVSGVAGTNNAAAATRTRVLGADFKAKLWTNARAYLAVQGELLRQSREDAAWDEASASYLSNEVNSTGGYVFADYNFNQRYDAGVSYERYQQPESGAVTDQAFGLFAGLALMEETTVFRVDWNRLLPGRPAGATEDPEAVNTLTLRVIFSMGPHKAHTF